MRWFLIPALLFAAACTNGPLTELPSRADPLPTTLPPVKTFSAATGPVTLARANADIARDFLELSFEMESGRKIEHLSRFEGPVTLALAQQGPALFQRDLADLLTRFRNEAGIDIRQIETGSEANIVVATLPQRKLQRTVPHAACFVVPRVRNWDEFRKNRRSGALDWTTLAKRERVTVFIPEDVSPQEARDCLHEEIAQALGPLNDIYRLPDSVYNDDNLNTILSPFDMLILKVHYSKSLKTGMTREAVAAALPAILDRVNPAGRGLASDKLQKSPRQWIDAVGAALGPRSTQSRRLASAQKSVAMAEEAGWHDNRLGFGLFAQGRLALGIEPDIASESFARAYSVYTEAFGKDDIHTAHVALQLAAFALSTGDTGTALELVNSSLSAANRAQNASLLATLLLIKAEALDAEGRHAAAAAVRLDALGWARYGFASEREIRARLREIGSLRPRSVKPVVG